MRRMHVAPKLWGAHEVFSWGSGGINRDVCRLRLQERCESGIGFLPQGIPVYDKAVRLLWEAGPTSVFFADALGKAPDQDGGEVL